MGDLQSLKNKYSGNRKEDSYTTKESGSLKERLNKLRGSEAKPPERTADKIMAELTEAERLRDEASKKRSNYTGRGSALMYADGAVAAAMNKNASANAEAEFQKYDAKVNALKSELYEIENQSKRKMLEADTVGLEAYGAASGARDDMTKWAQNLLVGPDAGYMEYLREQYGTDNVFEQFGAIRQKQKGAEDQLAELGYDFGRMADYEKRTSLRDARAIEQAENKVFAQEHPVIASAATVPVGVFQGVDYMKMAGREIANDLRGENDWRPSYTDDMYLTNFVSDIRGSVSEELEANTDWELLGENVASFLYNTGMSIADCIATISAAGANAGVLMGGAAAAQTAKTVVESGGTGKQAVVLGLASGAAEMVFEKFSIDNLLKHKDITSAKRLITETLKQGGIEASEEIATEASNILMNTIVMGGQSDFNRTVAYYMSEEGGGMNADEAKQRALKDCMNQVIMAGIGGFISGGVMGGVSGGVQYAANAIDKKISEAEYSRMIEELETKAAPVQAEAQTEAPTNVSERGKTVLTADDTDVDIESVSSVHNGKMTYRLTDGRVVSDDAVLHASADEAVVYNTVAELASTPGEANAMIEGYKNSGMSAGDFSKGIRTAHMYGKIGASVTELEGTTAAAGKISPAVRMAAYNAGKKAAGAEVATAQAVINAGKKAAIKSGGVEMIDRSGKAQNFREYVKNSGTPLDAKREAGVMTAELLHEATGVGFRFYESYINGEGNRVWVNESGQEESAPNGFYRSGGVIYVDLNAGNEGNGLVLYTEGHEVTHFIKEWSPAKFKVLGNAVAKHLSANGASLQELLDNQKAKARPAGREMTDDEAYEEVVADSMEGILADGKVMQQVMADIKQQDKSLWEKIVSWVKETVDKLKNLLKAYDGVKPDSAEGQMVAEMKDAIGVLEQLYADALKDAGESFKSALTELDVAIDADTESVAPTMFSERTWRESDYVKARDEAAKEIAKAINVSVQKAKDYIDDVNSIAKMIAEDRTRLDYFSSPGRSSFVSNVEYGGSFDFSTLCKKRRLLTGTFTAIQRALPNTALTAEEILEIRGKMKEAGLEVSCGLCYVEGSRANMGQFAKEFLKLYKKYYPDNWQPNMADVNTPDGIEWVRINHPECYEQYEYFWNHYGTLKPGDKNLFASQQKPKLYQLHTEYKGEILQKFKDDDNVEEKNLNGGIRMQSFSDFEIVHLIDTMQIIMDMSRVGLAGQAYTKVPDFAWALGDTGLKINLSLIAKDVDADGNLIFDDVEGMPIADAMALRDRYSANVGTICVAFTDEQLLAAMKDNRVDFVIPFHRSQWKKSQYSAMGLPKKTKDYTYMQNEKFIKPQYHEYRGRMVKDKATNYMPNEYWDFSKSGKENAVAYLEMCARNNKRPKFYKLLENNGDGSYSLKADGSTDGYWKLLIDFKMYDNNGVGSPQMPVKPDFNMAEATRMLNEYSGGHQKFPVAQGIVDEFVTKYKETHKDVKYSFRGVNKDGIEVYETSEDVKKLSYKERQKVFHRLMTEEYRGKTAKFVRNGHAYYATFEAKDINKNIYGDKLSDKKGWKAKISAGAEGDIFELVENAKYSGSLPEKGKKIAAHQGVGYWDYFIKNVQIDNIVFDLTANVRKKTGDAFVYSIQLNENKKIKASPPLDSQNSGLNRVLNASDIRVTQTDDEVKMSARDSEYLSAVENGDMETAQRMVDEAAEKAGYNVRAFHQTGARFTRFNTDNPVAGKNDSETPNGIFFKDNDHDIGLGGQIQMGVHLSMHNTLHFANRKEANAWYCKNIAGYKRLQDEMNDQIKPIDDQIKSLEDEMFAPDTTDERYEELDAIELDLIEQMRVIEDDYRGRLRSLLDEYFLNGKSGYDSIELDYDGHRWVNGKREDVHTYIIFDPAQVKSADPVVYDDNGDVIPLSKRFDETNPDIRYSLRDTLTDQEVLKRAAEGLAIDGLTPAEQDALKVFRKRMKRLEGLQEQRKSLGEQYRKERFTKDGDKDKAEEIHKMMAQTDRQIDKARDDLLKVEQAEVLRRVLKDARKIVEADERRRVRAKERERSDAREAKIRKDYAEKREKVAEGRKDRAEKKELRSKIRKTIRDLDKLLNKGDKKRNVKEDMKELVSAALRSSEILFTDELTNADLLRNGIGTQMTDKEQKHAVKAAELAEQLMNLDPAKYDSYDAMMAAETDLRKKLNYHMGQLSDVFVRERRRLNEARVDSVLSELSSAYASLQQSENDYVAGAYEENVYNYLDWLREQVKGTLIKDMSVSQLQELHKAYTMVLTTVRNANEVFAENLKESRAELATRAMREVHLAGGVHGLRSKVGIKLNAFDWNNLKPVYAFERIGSSTLMQLFKNIRSGEDKWYTNMRDANDFRKAAQKKFKYDTWDMDRQYDFTSASGLNFSLNLDQIMSLYAFSKREQAHDHLMKGGFVFDRDTEVVVEKHGVKMTYVNENARAHTLSFEILEEIIKTLTNDQRAYVDVMQEYLSSTMGEKGNEVSMKLYGVKMFGEKFYFPLRSAGQFSEKAKETDMQKQQGQVNLVNSTFAKTTVPHASNSIVLDGFTDVWCDHVNEMSMYNAFVLPLEDFRKVYSFSKPGKAVGDEPISVNSFIQSAYGRAATAYIDQLIKDLNGGALSDNRETIAKRMIALFKKASVFASASVIIQQPMSVARAFAEIDAKYFLGEKMSDGKRKTTWDELKKYAPVAGIKEMGYFDTGMGMSAREYLQAEEYSGAKDVAKAVLTDSTYRDEWLGRLPALADEAAWCAIWNAVKRETKSNNPKMDVRSEEFLQLCGERFTEIITKTQVYDSVLARSANMRSKTALMSMATSFMGEPTTVANMAESAFLKWRAGDKEGAKRQLGAVLVSTLMTSAAVSLVYAARDDDEDETYLEKYMQSFAVEIVDGINPMTYLPFVKDGWSILQGYDVERADMSLVTDLVNAVEKIVVLKSKDVEGMSDEEFAAHKAKLHEGWWGLADYLFAFFGLPVKNVRRDVKAAFNALKTVGEDLSGRDTTWGSLVDKTWDSVKNSIPVIGWMPSESKQDKLYDAIMRGDTVYADRLKGSYKDDKSLDAAIRKALRANDPRIREAAIAWNAGEHDEYMNIAKTIIAEKNFTQDNIVKAITAEAEKLAPDEGSEPAAAKHVGLFNMDAFGAAVQQGSSGMLSTIRSDIIDTHVRNGKTRDEAVNSFNESAKDKVRDLFMNGEITERAALNALTGYCGVDKDAAAAKVQYWAFKSKYPDIYVDDSWFEKYHMKVESSGIDIGVYMDYRNKIDGIEGKGMKERILDVIDSMPITSAQKDALYFSEGYAQSTLRKAPWH